MSENKNIRVENGVTTLNLIIEADACDMTATWRPSAAVTAMQLVTHYAREALGIDWATLSAKGALWVVSRVNVRLQRIPRMGEQIALQAIPLPPVKALYPWHFVFLDSNGTPLGEGETLWNLMDASTRRLTILPEINTKIPRTSQSMRGVAIPAAACEVDGAAERHTLTPVYTDLDINGHASHLRYIDWCCNVLGPNVLSKYKIPEFRISYLQEVCAGQTIDTELRMEGQHFSFSGYHGNIPAFVIDGTLASCE